VSSLLPLVRSHESGKDQCISPSIDAPDTLHRLKAPRRGKEAGSKKTKMVSMSKKDRRSTGLFSKTRLLFLVAIIAGAVFLVQFMNGNGGSSYLFEEGMTSNYSSLRAPLVDSLECRFYLAESAIPMGGLGLYTAIDIPKGAQAQSMEDICIYVADTPDDTDFDSHSWARDVWMGQWEGNNPRAACEGFATLFNSLPPGVATSELKSAMHVQTNAGLDRKTHPGAGAISHFYGITSEAVRDLSAGSELTIDYGDRKYEKGKKYEPTRRSPEWLRTHGMCIDNIEIHPATDPQMGRVSEPLSTKDVKSYCAYLTFSRRITTLLCRELLPSVPSKRIQSWHLHLSKFTSTALILPSRDLKHCLSITVSNSRVVI
jgi:hypothetical protein